MAILEFPAIVPDSITFGLEFNTQISTTSFTGIAQTVELPGARWKGSMNFTNLSVVDSAELKAFILELRGSSGRFYYGDISHENPFNTVTGTITAESASSARVLNITYDSGSELLSVGDYIQVGTDTDRELKMIIASNVVSGLNYDLTIEPMIRRTDYVGLTLDYSQPTGVFMLTSDFQGNWGVRGKGYYTDITLDFIEVFT